MDGHVKIFFEILSENNDEREVESVWATPCGQGFKLDNIPFYATGISCEDVVSAKKIDACLYMDELLEPSGHSTVRIWFSNENDIQSVRQTLSDMGCSTEVSDRPRLIAVDIPPSIPYDKIKSFLDYGEKDDKWDYQEACLGFL